MIQQNAILGSSTYR